MDADGLIDMLNRMAVNELTIGERILDKDQDQADRLIARDAAQSVIETARAILSLHLEAAA